MRGFEEGERGHGMTAGIWLGFGWKGAERTGEEDWGRFRRRCGDRALQSFWEEEWEGLGRLPAATDHRVGRVDRIKLSEGYCWNLNTGWSAIPCGWGYLFWALTLGEKTLTCIFDVAGSTPRQAV